MTMSDGEIVRSYQEAAHPVRQIKVLADLNDCTPAEIREVLKQAGYRFGRGGNPVQDTASPAYLPEEARVAHPDGLPAQGGRSETGSDFMQLLRDELLRLQTRQLEIPRRIEELQAELEQVEQKAKAVAEACRVLDTVYVEVKK